MYPGELVKRPVDGREAHFRPARADRLHVDAGNRERPKHEAEKPFDRAEQVGSLLAALLPGLQLLTALRPMLPGLLRLSKMLPLLHVLVFRHVDPFLWALGVVPGPIQAKGVRRIKSRSVPPT